MTNMTHKTNTTYMIANKKTILVGVAGVALGGFIFCIGPGISRVNAAQDFSVSASPSSESVARGASAIYNITMAGSNGFTGPVYLSVQGLPSGVSASFFITQLYSGWGTPLSLAAASNAAPQTSSFTVTGTGVINGSSVTRSATASITVTSGNTMTISPGNNPPAGTIQRAATSTLLEATLSSGAYACVSSIRFTQGGTAQQGQDVVLSLWDGNTLLGSGTDNFAVNFDNIVAPGSPKTFTLKGFVPVTATPGRTVQYSLNPASVSLSLGCGPMPVVNGGAVGNAYVVGNNTAQTDFSLAVGPGESNPSILSGGARTIPLAVSRTNSFSGDVVFSASGLPSGMTASFYPSVASVGKSPFAVIRAGQNVPAGNYSITLAGTSGSTSRSIPVVVTVAQCLAGFNLAVDNPNQTISQGQTASYSISATGGGGAVSLSAGTSGLGSDMVHAFSLASLVPGGTPSVFSITAASTTPLGAYSFSVTACRGTLCHSINSLSITVAAYVAPVTLNLTATPSIVHRSGSTLLTWDSTNAASCSASSADASNAVNSQWNGAVGLQGTKTVTNLTKTTTFGLRCLDKNQQPTSKSIQVRVVVQEEVIPTP